MIFDEIPGNESIKIYLRKGIQNHSLHHTLLFSGPQGSLFAHALAKELSAPPDLHVYLPEGKGGLHSIETIRELIDEVRKPPFQAKRKVFLLEQAERMQPAAANALLKTLEEPEQDSTIILITEKPQEILPTIVSRCIQLHSHSTHAIQEKTEVDKILIDALEKRIPVFHALEAIEASWSNLEGAALQQATHHLFTIYLFWAREQEKAGKPCLAQALAKVSTAQAALDRNVRCFACLDHLLA